MVIITFRLIDTFEDECVTGAIDWLEAVIITFRLIDTFEVTQDNELAADQYAAS